jgi:hypothetical protein
LKVKVIRAILHEGKRVEPGKVLDVPEPLAKELVFSGKCAFPGSEPAEPEKEKSKK